MAFNVLELVIVIIVCLLPFATGVILAVATVCQKTGTSDVLSWTSAGSGTSDPYQELREDRDTKLGDEEQSVISDLEESRGGDDLTRASASESSSEFTSDRQSERDSDRRSDRMSEYTYDY